MKAKNGSGKESEAGAGPAASAFWRRRAGDPAAQAGDSAEQSGGNAARPGGCGGGREGADGGGRGRSRGPPAFPYALSVAPVLALFTSLR